MEKIACSSIGEHIAICCHNDAKLCAKHKITVKRSCLGLQMHMPCHVIVQLVVSCVTLHASDILKEALSSQYLPNMLGLLSFQSFLLPLQPFLLSLQGSQARLQHANPYNEV